MAKICMAGAGSVIETAKLIKTEMLERGKVPPDLRAEVYHVQDGVGVALFVFERYYMRTSGFTSLTVAVTGDNEACLLYTSKAVRYRRGGRPNVRSSIQRDNRR